MNTKTSENGGEEGITRPYGLAPPGPPSLHDRVVSRLRRSARTCRLLTKAFTPPTKHKAPRGGLMLYWRRGWGSNPRGANAPNRFRVEIINQQHSFNQTVAPFSPLGSYSGIPPVTDVLCSGLLRFLYAANPSVIARNREAQGCKAALYKSLRDEAISMLFPFYFKWR